ncbi:MAG: phosphopyruvate hydratase [Verrucomicrobia bacterium]|nr:phosphopyruvate hydratase [Verrucomicrobiota bacterium]
MFQITELRSREILDSRGHPTVMTRCTLASGARGEASVPSGASTGSAEAKELRDQDPARYRGLGCQLATTNVEGPLFHGVRDRKFLDQEQLDQSLIGLDGSSDKSCFGANAILSISLAFARAAAFQLDLPLYAYFAKLAGTSPRHLPRLTVNLFSGGKHAGGQCPLQDVLMVPSSARDTDESLSMCHKVYYAAADDLARKYGTRLLRADEGGQAPPFPSAEAMITDAIAAIERAGLRPGHDMALAIDAASSHFHHQTRYRWGSRELESEALISEYQRWVHEYPIVSLEDGLAENDWPHWPALRRSIGDRSLVVGDDLLCTQPHRIRKAVALQAANALLLKVNQVGTLSEALEALHIARHAGWQVTVSARSGETEDHWLADLAVGWNADQIKIGSITQSERLAKYNRLLALESETQLPLNPWPGPAVEPG